MGRTAQVVQNMYSGLGNLLLEWVRHIETGEDRTVAMKGYHASDLRGRPWKELGPFELLADENREGVARSNEPTAVEDQSSKTFGKESTRRVFNQRLSPSRLQFLGLGNEKSTQRISPKDDPEHHLSDCLNRVEGGYASHVSYIEKRYILEKFSALVGGP